MIMNNDEDFASDVGKLWEQYDEGEITKKDFNTQIKIRILNYLNDEGLTRADPIEYLKEWQLVSEKDADNIYDAFKILNG